MARNKKTKKGVFNNKETPFSIKPLTLALGKIEYSDGSTWYPLASESWVTTNAPGTVTSIFAGTGLTGGTITSSGTIGLASVGITVGSYAWPTSLTINAQGQVTGANAGSQPITSIISSSGLTVTTSNGQSLINIFNTGVTSGTYTWPSAFSVNSIGQLTSVTNTGSLPINRLSGYPSSSSVFLRGDGVWSSPSSSSIDINVGTTGQLSISRLNGYPSSSTTFLCGDGTWSMPYINNLNINGTVSFLSYGLTTSGNLNATTGSLIGNNLGAYNSGTMSVQSPLSFTNIGSVPINITGSNSQNSIVLNNTNSSATSTGLLINVYNGLNGVEFGFNNFTNEAYVWASNSATLKFGTNSTKRMELLNNGSLIMYDNPTYGLSGTYGFLNQSGTTGQSAGSGYYSISCPNRIKASEFNAYSSEKKKRILSAGEEIEAEVIEKFRCIPFFKYLYKDPVREGTAVSYGVIAESLQKILPDYVEENGEDWIPNILQKASATPFQGHYHLKLAKIPVLLSKRLKLILKDRDVEVEIVSQEDCLLEIKCSKTLPDLVFVYGTYESCPSVSKQKLFEIGLVVIKNLLKRVEVLECKISTKKMT